LINMIVLLLFFAIIEDSYEDPAFGGDILKASR
jgi:hypothetical protein